ncbi:MAG: amidase, partial [bacterium]
MNLLEASIETLQEAMNSGSLTAVELTQYYLDRIATYDQQGPALNSIQTINSAALEHAAALDEERSKQGARSLLHGIPILVKDNYETKGMPTTVGSVLFQGYSPGRDAHLVAKLKDAGVVLLGKTTMQEFAYGITNVGSGHGFTRNPYDTTRNPGGSSGGTGAAVAANFAVTGLGSDTCGSIRIPAAQNNLVGLRGTQGLMSRRGIFPLSSTQDIGGPLTKSVRDLAIMLDQMIGYDAEDLQTAESFGHNFQFLANLQ